MYIHILISQNAFTAQKMDIIHSSLLIVSSHQLSAHPHSFHHDKEEEPEINDTAQIVGNLKKEGFLRFFGTFMFLLV